MERTQEDRMEDLRRSAVNKAFEERKVVCGFCGEPIYLAAVRDTSDLGRGWNHLATPSDWGQANCTTPTAWRHRGEVSNGTHTR